MGSPTSPASIPVFVDTNLATHLAVPVPPNITVGELKSILARDHFSCFPELGEIKVTSLMVKRRSLFYHLSDVMPLKVVFVGSADTWFLHMDAFPLMNMHREETTVHSMEKLSSMQISSNHRTGTSNPSTSVASQKLKSSRRPKWFIDRHEHDTTMQCNLNQETEDSVSDISDITNCSKSASNIRSGDLNAKCKAASSRRNHFTCNAEKLNVLSLPSFSRKENSKKTIGKQVRTKNTSSGSLNDLMEDNPASSKNKHVAEVTSTSILEIKIQTNLSTVMDVPTNMNQHDDNLLPENTLKSKKLKHMSRYANSSMSLSGKVSVTGLITRYFADYEEVDSSYIFPKDIEECGMFTNHFNVLNCEEIRDIGISALQGSSKRIAVTGSHNDCSFNVKSSGKRLSGDNNLLNVNNLQSGNNEVVSFSCDNDVLGTDSKTDTSTNFLVSDENSICQVDTETLYGERASRSKRKVRRKLLYDTISSRSRKLSTPSSVNKHMEARSRKVLYGTVPCRSRKISTPSSVNKHMEASSSKCIKTEVGKCLLQAAKSIWCSSSRKKSSKSMFISRNQCPLKPEGTIPMKNFSFEIDSETCSK
ncbi:uncharacterized protein [Typha angustifolia]|uniref:uncharacterized protein isoform X1 n=2 Tax=Typha angustifolia TaxID=59011 RepID=UPI003C2E0130